MVNGLEQNKKTINIGRFYKEFEELYLKMNSENEDERPTIDEILKYKWFDEIRNEDKNIEKEINNIFSLKRQLLLNEQNTLDYKYNIIKKINNDAYYERYLVKDIESEKQYIAAIRGNIEGIDNNEKYDFNHEVKMTKMASELNNPYIIHLENYGTGIFIYEKKIEKNRKYLIYDYYPNGDLSEYITIDFGGFKEFHSKYIFDKILRGVKALHEAGICHRDLKPSNIFLDDDFNPKIYNFLISAIFLNDKGEIKFNDMAGSGGYINPQMVNRELYSGDKADIYSLGIILYILHTGQLPKAFLLRKQNNNFLQTIPKEIMDKFSPELKNLLTRMIIYNESDRPSIDEILNDKWFDEIRQLDKESFNEVNNEFLLRREKIKNKNKKLDKNLK